MKKESAYLPLVTTLAGAAIGALSMPDDRTGGAVVGAGVGNTSGLLTDLLASAISVYKLNKQMKAFPDMSAREKKLLVAAAKRMKLPLYQQLSGRPLDNAAYVDGNIYGLDGDWKDLTTGKKQTSPTSPGIYIGLNYKKAPVIAHELGHAQDLKDASKAYMYAPIALRVGAALTGFIGSRAYSRSTSRDARLGIACATLAGSLGMSTIARAISEKQERAASDIAMQNLSKHQNKNQIDKSRALLDSAYSTYEPLPLLPRPEFGSGEYAKA